MRTGYTPYPATLRAARSAAVTAGTACEWMRQFDNFPEPFAGHMGVNLSRRDVGVTQQGLDASEVRAAFDKMGCESMPDDVWRQPFRIDPCINRKLLHELVATPSCQMSFGAV
jgi:hypothetical protein